MAQDSSTTAADATGLALSPRQALLLAELQRSSGELSGQDLHARLRGGPGAMGLATVYRHLRLLQQRGMVRCRHLPSGEALYAPRDRDQHHLTCVDCGRTRLLSHCPVHDGHLHDTDLAGFLPLFHTLEFFGLCEACRKRQSEPWSDPVSANP